MATKLEWKHSLNDGDEWHAGRWVIRVARLTGFFYAGSTDKKIHGGNWPTRKEAADWCQSQEDAAAPVELPEVGSVWGVPGKPETRRMFGGMDHDGEFVKWYGPHNRGVESVEQWQSWVRESGAVRIDGEGERVKELEAEVARLHNLNTQMAAIGLGDMPRELDDARAAVGRLLEALRGIEGHDSDACDHEDYGGCWKWVRRLAREAIAKEEGGRG